MTAAILSRRRGVCPGLSAPMATGDGLLVRLTPTGTMPLDAFTALCAAAQRHGSGIIEVTARGNIQVRGLTPDSAPRFASAVAALDIAAADGIPVLTNPLAGLDPDELIDAAALAAELRRALTQRALGSRLAAKASVVIDGGGSLGLDDIAADVRLCAVAGNGPALRIALGGDAANAGQLGMVALGDGIAAVARLLETVAAFGPQVRARDVVGEGDLVAFRSAVADLIIGKAPPHAAHPGVEAIGVHWLRDGTFAYGVGLAFGHADATSLQRLAAAADAAGARGLRAAAGRVLMIIGLAQPALSSVAAAAENLGFIVRTDDPRRHVVACAGAPLCASGHIATRAIGPAVAAAAAAHLDGAFQIHISGCAKGCAHPAPAPLTLVGTPDGCALVAAGSARDACFAVVAIDDLSATIAKIAGDVRRDVRDV